MFTSIALKNFKSISKVQMKLGRINIFIGPNGSGKSSILQSLMLIKQSIDSPDLRPNGEKIELGLLSHLLKSGTRSFSIQLLSRYSPDVDEIERIDLDHSPGGFTTVIHHFKLEANANNITSLKMGFRPRRRNVREFILEKEWNPILGERRESFHYNDEAIDFNIRQRIGNIFDFQINGTTKQKKIASLLNALSQTFERKLMALSYVPAHRGFTRPSYNLLAQSVKDLSSSSQDRQNQNVATTLGMRRDLEDTISEWMEKVTGVGIRGSLEEGPHVSVEVVKKTINLNIPVIHDGFGTNQLIQLLLTLAISEERSTILIEEPEIHLHPKAQALLAELLVKIAVSRNLQLMITTHSEHILFRILSMIKTGDLEINNLNIFHFDNVGGTSNIEQMVINEHGQIKGGLKSFFEAELDQFKMYFQNSDKT